MEAVKVPVYPTNIASIKGEKEGPVKELRLAAGTLCISVLLQHASYLSYSQAPAC